MFIFFSNVKILLLKNLLSVPGIEQKDEIIDIRRK
jgi:hypothetical protein